MLNSTSEVREYIMKNRDIFEDVQKARHENSGTSRVGEHSILNYPKMIEDMVRYVEGFKKYKNDGNKEYKHKVLQSTYNFYNGMFSGDEKSDYRKKISLSEFPNLNYKFIEKSKKLHQLIQELKGSIDNETLNLITVTEKQYKKIAKVNKDDMKIYMWLSANMSISAELRTFYEDPRTPVMHKVKK